MGDFKPTLNITITAITIKSKKKKNFYVLKG